MAIVTFNDPIAKEEISYHISGKLEEKWKNLSKKIIKKNGDRVYVVGGRERGGKSTWVFQQAKYIDHFFNIKRICFTPEQFLDQIRTAPPGGVVVFDEAFRGFSSKSTLSKVNKMLVQAMMEVGRRNLVIFIVLPSYSLLENYVAIHRSHALFQVYERKDALYRGWRCYNRKKKAQIYFKSKRSYGITPYTPTKLKGKFFIKRITLNGKKVLVPYTTFDIKAYDDKKFKAFGTGTDQKENDPFKDALENLRFKLFNIDKSIFPIRTKKQFGEAVCEAYGTYRGWKRFGKGKETRKMTITT